MSHPAQYQRNKLRTAYEIYRRIRNWPTAFGLRLRQNEPGLRLLNFRDGLNVVCRGATRDWDVIHELLFAQSYGRAMDFLAKRSGRPLVLDFGGNIGLFSLLAASINPTAEIQAFEPGPPNYRLLEMNRLANPGLAERITLRKEAVGGSTRRTEWFFDEANPGGSGLVSRTGEMFPVQVVALAEIVARLDRDVALAKIDIEGAEFEILADTPAQTWSRIGAISLELHEDPAGRVTQEQFLAHLCGCGFRVEVESVCSFFLSR